MDENFSPEEIRKARNEYYREWRKKNPDKVKAAQLRYWQRKLEKEKGNRNITIPENAEYR